MRKTMVEAAHPQLSLRQQCRLLGINRNRLKPRVRQVGAEDLRLARRMDEIALRFPEYGSRRHARTLEREGRPIGRERVRRLMRKMGLRAIYRRPRTSQPGKGHRIYPYLLRDREITQADEVWCADITYIPMAKGFAYLVAVMDWKSRAVEGAGSRVSMDGKGCWVDNVFIERLWRAVKHEGVYLWAYENLHDLERALGQWFADYNGVKPHSALHWQTPWEHYRPQEAPRWRTAA